MVILSEGISYSKIQLTTWRKIALVQTNKRNKILY